MSIEKASSCAASNGYSVVYEHEEIMPQTSFRIIRDLALLNSLAAVGLKIYQGYRDAGEPWDIFDLVMKYLWLLSVFVCFFSRCGDIAPITVDAKGKRSIIRSMVNTRGRQAALAGIVVLVVYCLCCDFDSEINVRRGVDWDA